MSIRVCHKGRVMRSADAEWMHHSCGLVLALGAGRGAKREGCSLAVAKVSYYPFSGSVLALGAGRSA